MISNRGILNMLSRFGQGSPGSLPNLWVFRTIQHEYKNLAEQLFSHRQDEARIQLN